MGIFHRLFAFHNGRVRMLLRCFGVSVLLLVVLFEFSYPFQAEAFIHESAQTIAKEFFSAIFAYIANLLLAIVLVPLVIVASAINMMLSAIMIVLGLLLDEALKFAVSAPYTANNSALLAIPDNPLKIGWEVVRDLANMGLLFVLIAIAIGTILQIGATRWRSLFIPFVAIALLINFTPVITGLVIDLSNILTKVFFDQAGGAWKAFANVAIKAEISGVLNSIGKIFGALGGTVSTVQILNDFLNVIFMIVFQILVIATFVTLIFIIFARILALWLLVILSPLAFVAYILPATRHYFSGWWHNFFQWSIITIPFGFFIWLAALFLSKKDVLCTAGKFDGNLFDNLSGGTSGGNLTDIAKGNEFLLNMCSSMMLLMAIGILFVGIMVAFSSSATGSKLIVGGGVAAGAVIGGWAAAKAGGLATRGTERLGGAAASRLPGQAGREGLGRFNPVTRERAQRLGEIVGGARRGAVSQLEKRAGTLGPAGGALAKGAQAGREISEKTGLFKVWKATTEEKRKKFESQTTNLRKESTTWGDDDWTERLRTLPGMVDEKTMATLKIASEKGKDITDAKYKLSRSQRRALYEKASEYKILEDVARRNPTDVLANASDTALETAFKTTSRDEARQKILSGIRPEHLRGDNRLSTDALETLIGDPLDPASIDQFAELAQYLTIEKLRAVKENYAESVSEKINEQIKNLKKNPIAFAKVHAKNKTFLRQASGKNPAWEQAGYENIMPNPKAFDAYDQAHQAWEKASKPEGAATPPPQAFENIGLRPGATPTPWNGLVLTSQREVLAGLIDDLRNQEAALVQQLRRGGPTLNPQEKREMQARLNKIHDLRMRYEQQGAAIRP